MYLVTQSSYNCIDLGIFQNRLLLKKVSIDKIDATKFLILELDKLLSDLKMRLSNLDFIAANRGPAPFTTLRVLLTTINGIAFSTKIPLVEVDGLETLLESNISDNYEFTLAILNAFGGDAYFGFKGPDETKFGCKKIDDLVAALKIITENKKINVIGNGVEIFRKELSQLNTFVLENCPKYTSLEEVAEKAFHDWQKQKTVAKIMPLYLKEAV